MYQTIEPERLYERIIQQIEKRILSGELHVGDQLPSERELALQFGVSRTAVREAIKILSQKGLLLCQTGRGTFVADQTFRAASSSLQLLVKISSGEGLEHLEEVREVLEPEIAFRAASRATDREIAAMRDAVNRMDAVLSYRASNKEISNSVDAWIQDPYAFAIADHSFHLALAEATQNPLFPALTNTIVDLLREQRRLISLRDGAAGHGQYYHKRILEAIIARDPEAARQVMQAHLQQVREDIRASRAASEK